MMHFQGGNQNGGYSAPPVQQHHQQQQQLGYQVQGYGQQGYHQQGYQQSYQQQAHPEQYHDPVAELDRVVNASKNMRDGSRTDTWIEHTRKLMLRIKLDAIPDSTLVENYGTSEAGTDISQAATHDYIPPPSDALSPPDSPAWRRKNEGGVITEIPAVGSYSWRSGGEAALFSASVGDVLRQSVPPAYGGAKGAGGGDSPLNLSGRAHAASPPAQSATSQKAEALARRDLLPRNPSSPNGAFKAPASPPIKRGIQPGGSVTGDPGRSYSTAGGSAGPGVPPATAGGAVAGAGVAGKQVTLGITFGRGDASGVAVVRLKDGGVAQLQGGLAVGDKVLSIDGTSVVGLNPVEINKLVVGPQGSVAVLEIIRRDSPEGEAPRAVSLLRDISAAPGAALSNTFGVVRKG